MYNALIGESKECFVEAKPNLLSYKTWSWRSAFRLSKECKLGRGWSGGAVINSATGELIGIISGGSDKGSLEDYAETDHAGNKSAFVKQSYFMSLVEMSECLMGSGSSMEGCMIENGFIGSPKHDR